MSDANSISFYPSYHTVRRMNVQGQARDYRDCPENVGLSRPHCELFAGRSPGGFPGSTTHNYRCYGTRKHHLHTLAHILAALACASPDPGSGQPPANILTQRATKGRVDMAIVIPLRGPSLLWSVDHPQVILFYVVPSPLSGHTGVFSSLLVIPL